eukprot:gene13438-21139_t
MTCCVAGVPSLHIAYPMSPRTLLLERTGLLDALLKLSRDVENGRSRQRNRARLAEMDRTKIKTDAAESNKIKTSEFLRNVEFVTTKRKLQ